MSALDTLVKHHLENVCEHIDKNDCVFVQDLARLRAAASEADALRAERDELKAKANVSVCAWCGQECEKESGSIAEHVISCDKRPEHAMLSRFEQVLATVADQARKLEVYHAALVDVVELGKDSHVAFDGERWREMWKVAATAIESWRLAANAPTPAPEAEQETTA